MTKEALEPIKGLEESIRYFEDGMYDAHRYAEHHERLILAAKRYLNLYTHVALQSLEERDAENTSAAQGWQPIETAPRDKRVLVRTEYETYCAHWVKNPYTEHEAWIVAEWGDDGDQALVLPLEWMPLPAPPAAENGGDDE